MHTSVSYQHATIYCLFSKLTKPPLTAQLLMCFSSCDAAPSGCLHYRMRPFPESAQRRLVASRCAAGPTGPVDDYKAQTHYHKGDTQSGKKNSLKMRERGERFNYPEVWRKKNTNLQSSITTLNKTIKETLVFAPICHEMNSKI